MAHPDTPRRAARRLFLGLLCGLCLGTAGAAEAPAQSGASLLAMCKGADRVRTLAVMCHSYVNGFIDAAGHYGRPAFCLSAADHARVPRAVADWLGAHPEHLKQPAAAALHKALAASFPCGRK